MLYDQTGTADVGAQVLHDSNSPSYDSEAADDFVVTDAAGWTVTAFNFQTNFNGGTPVDPTFDVVVYPDNGGTPGDTPACSYDNLAGVLDGSLTNVSVALSSNCVLAQGTYWVSFTPDYHFPPQAFWPTLSGATIGAEGVWRNPGGGYGTTCTTSAWSPVTSCTGFLTSPIGGGDTNFTFQVIGSVGGGGGGTCGAGELCLDTTVGTDTSAGACATTDTIDASVGDQINFCYTITNNTGVELDYHTLSDNVNGTYFTLLNQPVPDGGTFQYNRIATVSQTETYNSTWTGQDLPPGYSAEITGGGGGGNDRIFCDGFDGTSCAPLSTGGFVDITTTGTPLGLSDDGNTDVTMPFSFNFYGTTSNQLSIANNGGAIFNAPGVGLAFTNTSLPAALGGPAMLPLWDDFDAESGDVYYDTRGTTPNRQFIVEWFNRVHYDGTANTDGATFELILNEDGTIQFEYLDATYTGMGNASGDPDDCSGGACATIGLQNDSTLFNQFSAFEVAVTDNSGITWTPTSPQVFMGTDTATVNVGAPDIDVQPPSLSGTVPADGTSSIPFDIDNLGDRDLNWTADEAPAPTSHMPFGPRYVASNLKPGERASAALHPPQLALQKPGASLSRPNPHPAGVATTPSYGCVITSSSSCDFVSFDADAPGTLTTVGTVNELTFAGAFVDNDFTKEYILGYPSGALETVSTSDASVTSIGGGVGQNGRGITWDSMTNTLFGAVINNAPSSGIIGTDLYTIDTATGNYTLVGEITGDVGASGYVIVMGIAVDPQSGLMYGVEIVTDTLVAIDKTTGTASTIGSIGYPTSFAQGMGFNPSTDTLYLQNINQNTGQSVTATVDTSTGTATVIGEVGSAIAQMGAFAIAVPNGPCATPQDLPWLSLSSTSGTTPPAGTSSVSADLDGTGFADGDTLAGTVCVYSNDPDEHTVEVPVEVTVGTGGGGGGVVDSGPLNYAINADFTGLYINWLTGDTCDSATDTGGDSCNTFGYYNFNPWASGGNLNFAYSDEGQCVSDGTSCLILSSGATIGPASTFSTGNAINFRAGTTEYIGFAFDNAGTTNYGYAQMTTTGTTGFPATLVRYWYDNTGAAITIP